MSELREGIFVYNPLPVQLRFHTSTAILRFYGGAAGGGKSKALRMECFRQCYPLHTETDEGMDIPPESSTPINALFLRRTFAELEASIIRPMLNELPAGTYEYNSSKHLMRFPNGSTLNFSHCQHEEDVRKHQGVEYDLIAIDELTHFTEFQYSFLLSRLRTTKPNIVPNFISAGNPGGVGHVWVKRLWIDRNFKGKERPQDYAFIPARIYDNHYLTDNDPSYLHHLESLPETERRAMLEGDWNIFDGQFFREFRDDLHVIDPIYPKDAVRRIIALDYGYFAPSAVLWIAQTPDEKFIVYRELYVTEHTYGQLAARIKALTKADEEINLVYADPAIVNKRNEATGTTGGDEFRKQGLTILPADNTRVDGWGTVREALQPYFDQNAGKKTARLQITRNCPNLLRTLPQLQHDKRHVEDIDSSGEDHAADALRYGLRALWTSPTPVSAVKGLNSRMKRSRHDRDDHLRTDW